MPMVDIDLNSVVEKPRLPAAQPFTFRFIQAQLGISKTPNKKSGVREPLVTCKIAPMDSGWEDREVYHNFSLAMGALQSDDPCMSIKKFFLVVDHKWDSNGGFAVEDLYNIKFVGTVKYKEGSNFASLASVIQGVK